MTKEEVKSLRVSVRSEAWKRQGESDQSLGVPAPAIMLAPGGAPMTVLPRPEDCPVSDASFLELVKSRRSRRLFDKEAPLTQLQLSYLLYCCQGYECPRPGQSYAALRTVPSAGCRHALDTYLSVRHVEGMEPGIYRFLPREHALELVELHDAEELRTRVGQYTNDQIFCGDAPVCFFFAADMYRSEWRYPMSAHKVVLLDAGHACQNLYMACEVLGLGTCAIGAYQQENCDALLHIDGEDVFTVYVAPVGIPR